MADDTSLFKEIDESMRVENMERLFLRYGKIIVAAAVCIVLATVSLVIMKSHHHTRNIANTALLLKADRLAAEGNYTESSSLLESLLQNGHGMTALATFRIAENAIKAGEFDKARAEYNTLAAQTKNDAALRELAELNALVIAANHHLPQDKKEVDSFKSLAEKNSTFSATAGEMLAIRLEKEGRHKEARDALDNITNNPSMTASDKQLATALREGLDSGSLQEEKK